MDTPTRVAVIGSGRWGKNIIATLAKLPECTVTHTATRDYKTLLTKDDIDAVVVATPGSTHAEVALPFIRKGLPVFIEKPLTTKLADAKKINLAAKKHRVPVFVGHVHLYNPAYHAAKKAVVGIGNIRLMVGEGRNNGPYRDDMSAMWDWAPHDIAMMLDLVGKKPATVQAWGLTLVRPTTKLYDTSYIKLDFGRGVVGIISSSWISPTKTKKVTVVGTKSIVVYEDSAEHKVTLYDGMGPTVSGKKAKENQPVVSYPSHSSEMPLTEELKAFVEMVQKKKKPLTDLAQGLDVVAILDAAERSIAAGGRLVSLKNR